MLHQKTNNNFECWKLQPDDICGLCLCKDDARILKKILLRLSKSASDCLDNKQVSIKENGFYKIHQNILKIIQVCCDQTTDGGGWTIFQRRIDGSVNFFRDWEHYKKGLDNLQNEFWLGNKNIFTLTLQGLYLRGNELWIDILNAKKIKKYVRYANFHTTDDVTKYNLLVNGYTGTLNDEVKHHNRQKFSTFDSDNDAHFTTNCASIIFRAWWFNGFNSCQYSLYSGDKM